MCLGNVSRSDMDYINNLLKEQKQAEQKQAEQKPVEVEAATRDDHLIGDDQMIVVAFGGRWAFNFGEVVVTEDCPDCEKVEDPVTV